MAQAIQTQSPTLSERQWAAAAHGGALVLAVLTSWAAGLAGALAAFGVWMVVRDRDGFAAAHAKEALNFNLSMFLYAVAAGAVGIGLVGATVFTLGLGAIVTIPAGLLLLLVLAGLAATWLVCSILATLRAFDGQPYRYPLTLRLF